jgi:hypothetical protein
MGGPVFAREGFLSLEREWTHTLAFHDVEPPVHMKDFARPHGRLANLTNEERRGLLHDLVCIINRRKAYGLTVAVDSASFRGIFPHKDFKKAFGPTPLAFLWCMVLNYGIVKERKEQVTRIAYFLSNSPVNIQMHDCYDFFRFYEPHMGMELTGSIGFDSPKWVSALQAADMVAWANRKKQLDEPFNNGFEPLELLTPNPPLGFERLQRKPIIHFHYPVHNASTKRLTEILGTPTHRKGKRESLFKLIAGVQHD